MINHNTDYPIASGVIERIGSEALLTFRTYQRGKPDKLIRATSPLRDHQAAISKIIQWLTSGENPLEGLHSLADIHAVGHRIVHGGEKTYSLDTH